MKKLILLLLFIPLFSFGQISISDMIKVGKMDRESFEIYALEKGYRFEKITNEENYDGLTMSISGGKRTEYLSQYSKWPGRSFNVSYQGPAQERLSSIYKELRSLNFVLVNTAVKKFDGDESGTYVKTYKKGDKESVIIYVFEDGMTCEIGYGKLL